MSRLEITNSLLNIKLRRLNFEIIIDSVQTAFSTFSMPVFIGKNSGIY